MKKKLVSKKSVSIIIALVFISIIIIYNSVHISLLNTVKGIEKVEVGINQLKNENFILSGKVSLAENKILEKEVKLEFNGIINNKTNQQMIEAYITSELLFLEKKLGTFYKDNQMIILSNEDNKIRRYQIENSGDTSSKFNKLAFLQKEYVYEKVPIVIKEGNYRQIRINTNKVSVMLSSDDILYLLDTILDNKIETYNDIANYIKVEEYVINVDLYMDYKNRIRKISVLCKGDLILQIDTLFSYINKKIMLPKNNNMIIHISQDEIPGVVINNIMNNIY